MYLHVTILSLSLRLTFTKLITHFKYYSVFQTQAVDTFPPYYTRNRILLLNFFQKFKSFYVICYNGSVKLHLYK